MKHFMPLPSSVPSHKNIYHKHAEVLRHYIIKCKSPFSLINVVVNTAPTMPPSQYTQFVNFSQHAKLPASISAASEGYRLLSRH